MRLKNSIDYKRFPEPSRGDWTRFTILVLSAEMPCRTLCKAFLVKSIPKNIPILRKTRQKKLLAVGQLFAKEPSHRLYFNLNKKQQLKAQIILNYTTIVFGNSNLWHRGGKLRINSMALFLYNSSTANSGLKAEGFKIISIYIFNSPPMRE